MSTNFKAFYKSPWGVAFMAYFVAMGLVGALTPQDILTAYSWTRPFTDFMASIVPQIDKVTALGIDPDINRFYFSVMWAGGFVEICVLLYMVYMWGQDGLKAPEGIFRLSFFKSLKVMSGLAVLAFLSYHLEYMTIPNTRKAFLTFGSAWGRFFIPQLFVQGPIFLGLPVFFWVIGWLTGHIPNNIRKQNELESTHGE